MDFLENCYLYNLIFRFWVFWFKILNFYERVFDWFSLRWVFIFWLGGGLGFKV